VTALDGYRIEQSEQCASVNTTVEDRSLAERADATRAAMARIFGPEALSLHAALAAQFAQRMLVDTVGGTVLPAMRDDGMFVGDA